MALYVLDIDWLSIVILLCKQAWTVEDIWHEMSFIVEFIGSSCYKYLTGHLAKFQVKCSISSMYRCRNRQFFINSFITLQYITHTDTQKHTRACVFRTERKSHTNNKLSRRQIHVSFIEYVYGDACSREWDRNAIKQKWAFD